VFKGILSLSEIVNLLLINYFILFYFILLLHKFPEINSSDVSKQKSVYPFQTALNYFSGFLLARCKFEQTSKLSTKVHEFIIHSGVIGF
jgi:hypothetical protein